MLFRGAQTGAEGGAVSSPGNLFAIRAAMPAVSPTANAGTPPVDTVCGPPEEDPCLPSSVRPRAGRPAATQRHGDGGGRRPAARRR